MSIKKIPYIKSKVYAPGEFLLEAINERSMSQAELAKRINRPLKLVNEIINGKTAITPETALQLEQALNISARFWNNLESSFRDFISREKALLAIRHEYEESKKYPYNEMAKNGWVPTSRNTTERTQNLLVFFGVTSLKNILERQSLQPIGYRISKKANYSLPAISAWLRQGVIEAQEIETDNFDIQVLKEAINNIRENMTKDIKTLYKSMRELLAKAGVAFTVVASLPKAPINGASRWIAPEKALIQLSLRYGTSDIFWFSFFHEIGHIIKHGKKELNIKFNNGDQPNQEKEADEYSADLLIPKLALDAFLEKKDFSIQSIERFSSEINTLPGIVLGRLQYERYIPFNKFNYLKSSYTLVKEG